MDETIWISENFTLYDVQFNEIAHRQGIANTITDDALIENARKLADLVLEPILADFGPVFVTSWYRCENLEREYQRNTFARWCIKNRKPIREDVWQEFLADKQDHTKAQCVTLRARDNDALFDFIGKLPTFDVLVHKTHWVSVSIGDFNQRRIIHE